MRRDHDGGRGGTPYTRWSLFESEMRGECAPLPGAERSEDDGCPDALLAAVAAELRAPAVLDPGLDARVMALVAAAPGPRRPAGERSADLRAGSRGRSVGGSVTVLDRAWRWLRRPRLVTITPLGGLAALAGAAALMAAMVRVASGGGAPAAPAADLEPRPLAATAPAIPAHADTVQVVQFVLVAPEARTVALVGDFNDWQDGATLLRASAAGRVWSVEVPLSAGRHRYAFVVDGEEWVPDPTAPRAPGDDFGAPSSVVTVAERRS